MLVASACCTRSLHACAGCVLFVRFLRDSCRLYLCTKATGPAAGCSVGCCMLLSRSRACLGTWLYRTNSAGQVTLCCVSLVATIFSHVLVSSSGCPTYTVTYQQPACRSAPFTENRSIKLCKPVTCILGNSIIAVLVLHLFV